MIQTTDGGLWDGGIVGPARPVTIDGVEGYPVRLQPPVRMGCYVSTSPVTVYLRADMIVEPGAAEWE